MHRFFLLLALFFPIACRAESDAARALGELRNSVKFYTLSNGLRVVFYKRDLAPVFSGVVAVRVGGSDEEMGETGISHMLEHMAFKGTDRIGTRNYAREKKLLQELEELSRATDSGRLFTDDQRLRWDKLQAELAKILIDGEFVRQYRIKGASSLNATTDVEFTKYFVNFPREAFEFWCRMESQRIINPVMRQFYQERDVVLEERRMRFEDDPSGRLYELLKGTVFLRHPYRFPVIGYANDVSSLSADQVSQFRKEYYVASNIVISVVGDIEPDEGLPVIERYFSALSPAKRPPLPEILEPEQEGERSVVLEHSAAPQLYIAYRKPVFPHPDDAPISVMSEMLAGSTIAPLYKEMVRKRQLAADVDSEEAPGAAYPNTLIFSITPRSPHSNEDNLEAFDQVLKDFRSNEITDTRLSIAKHALTASYLQSIRSSLGLAQAFSTSVLLYGDWAASLDWYEQALRVSLEDVSRVFDKYLVKRNRTIAKLNRVA